MRPAAPPVGTNDHMNGTNPLYADAGQADVQVKWNGHAASNWLVAFNSFTQGFAQAAPAVRSADLDPVSDVVQPHQPALHRLDDHGPGGVVVSGCCGGIHERPRQTAPS